MSCGLLAAAASRNVVPSASRPSPAPALVAALVGHNVDMLFAVGTISLTLWNWALLGLLAATVRDDPGAAAAAQAPDLGVDRRFQSAVAGCVAITLGGSLMSADPAPEALATGAVLTALGTAGAAMITARPGAGRTNRTALVILAGSGGLLLVVVTLLADASGHLPIAVYPAGLYAAIGGLLLAFCYQPRVARAGPPADPYRRRVATVLATLGTIGVIIEMGLRPMQAETAAMQARLAASEPSRAVPRLEWAIALAPRRDHYRLSLAEMLDLAARAERDRVLRDALFDRALEMLDGVSRAAAGAPEPWLARARILRARARLASTSEARLDFSRHAIDAARRAVELSPNRTSAWIQLGGALLGGDQPRAARTAFTDALALAPHALHARFGRLMADLALGAPGDPLADLRRFLADVPHGPPTLAAAAVVWARLDCPGTAREYFARATRGAAFAFPACVADWLGASADGRIGLAGPDSLPSPWPCVEAVLDAGSTILPVESPARDPSLPVACSRY
jgi:tetratricopeptide (TPR) repeat protein